MPQLSTSSNEAAATSSPDLGLTMTQILRNPLAALRASMESLASEFRADDPRSLQVSGALKQVLAMTRDVESLMHLAAPRPLAPLCCSVDEILRTALRRQRFEHASRVRLASGSSESKIVVDGPLLADCLGRLLENALTNTRDWVLLSARRESDGTHFCVVLGAGENEDERAADRELSLHDLAALELGLALARRDVERMNARLDITRTPLGNTCIRVVAPDVPTTDATTH